jgi:glycosyltransferase involved in cell wall biosynthesis
MRVGIVCRSQVDYALDLANELHQSGTAVNLYLDGRHIIDEVGDALRPVERLYEVGLLPSDCPVHLLQLPRMRDLRSFLFFRSLVDSMQADGIELVHILLNPGEIWFALLASFLRKIPVVTTVIVPVANTGDNFPGSMVWATNKLAILGSDMVIVNGADQVELVENLYKLSASRLAYVPLSMHARAAKWDSRSVPEQAGTVLFFGRAHPHKGLEYLVKAQPLISKSVAYAHILISAHGDDLDRCQQMIVDPDRFEITEGFVSGDKMAELFQRSALIVLPYLTASTSGVLVTAYSFGKPVVASRVGCLSEYVEDGVTGILVEPANVEELANAVVHLLQDDGLRRQMGENAKNRIIEMQKAAIAQTLLVYEKAIAIYLKNNRTARAIK